MTHAVGEARTVIELNRPTVGLIGLSGKEGEGDLDAIEKLFQCGAEMRWIAILDQVALRRIVCRNLVAQYCYDFHTRPVDELRLRVTIGRALGMGMLEVDSGAAGSEGSEYHMAGASTAMREVYASIRRCATSDAPVLLIGETGTGKELAAQAIHERSLQAKGPFVPVNCGAIPPDLIQSELFGYERGAFTGASQAKKGYIESARGGTLFLDEIGDLPLRLQVSLLRFLQDGLVQPVGSLIRRPANVRVIAATHVDLDAAINNGQFREDLYYRLNVLRLRLPPLRERDDDSELLAQFFLKRFAKEASEKNLGFSRSALKAIREHQWPGNVRELINRVRRAVVLCDGAAILPADLGLTARDAAPTLSLEAARGKAERTAIEEALRVCDKNVSGAARRLGVSRSQLYEMMGRHGVSFSRSPDLAKERPRIIKHLRQCRGNVTAAARELGMSRASLYRRLAKFGIGPDFA